MDGGQSIILKLSIITYRLDTANYHAD